MNNNPQHPAPLRVLIIGAGFGGLGLAIRLQQCGIEDFLILERPPTSAAPGVTTPTPARPATCLLTSTPSPSSPSSTGRLKFAPQAEIHAYQQQCAERHGLRRRIRFGTEVAGARFDEEAALWRVETTTGEHFSARALISACVVEPAGHAAPARHRALHRRGVPLGALEP